MNLLGLPWTWFGAGLAAIAASLLVLHLLRVRLRRVSVETLMFFRMVGAVQQPRVLLGKPGRWLAFLLALVLGACLWLAFADPLLRSDEPSRVVIIDASGSAGWKSDDELTLLEHGVERAQQMLGELGPDGAVLVAGAHLMNLYRSGEPRALLLERARGIIATGPGSHLLAALERARTLLDKRGEIVVIGGSTDLPGNIGGVRIRRETAGTLGRPQVGIAGITLRDWPARSLQIELAATGDERQVGIELQHGDQLLDSATTTLSKAGSRLITLGKLPAQAASVLLIADDPSSGREEIAIDLPSRRAWRVRVDPGVPLPARLAVEADPAFELVESQGELMVTTEPQTSMPGVQIVEPPEASSGQTQATRSCPLNLSLRDHRPDAARYATQDHHVWVFDPQTGAALVQRLGQQVQIATSLLDDPTHPDVTRLIAGSLRLLARIGDAPLVGAGRPFSMMSGNETPALLPLQPTPALSMPMRGRYGLTLPTPGHYRLGDSKTSAVKTLAAPPGGRAPETETASFAGSGRLLAWFLAIALLLLLTDVWLYHRGRLP